MGCLKSRKTASFQHLASKLSAKNNFRQDGHYQQVQQYHSVNPDTGCIVAIPLVVFHAWQQRHWPCKLTESGHQNIACHGQNTNIISQWTPGDKDNQHKVKVIKQTVKELQYLRCELRMHLIMTFLCRV